MGSPSLRDGQLGCPVSEITLGITQLRRRGREAQRILSPLRRGLPPVASESRSLRTHFVVGIHDGQKTSARPRDWLFRTAFPPIRGNYFEYWQPAGDELYSLERAYLNLIRLESYEIPPRAFLSLHCDPRVEEEEPHWQYKRGPHLHLQAAGEPFSRAHLCLSHGYLDLILYSIGSLTGALQRGIELVSEEILAHLLVRS